jgi:hypothetical protein
MAGKGNGQPFQLAAGDQQVFATQRLNDALLDVTAFTDALNQLEIAMALGLLLAQKHA